MVHQPDVEELASRIRIRTTAGAAQMMQQQRLVSGQRFEVQRSPRNSRKWTHGNHTSTVFTSVEGKCPAASRSRRRQGTATSLHRTPPPSIIERCRRAHKEGAKPFRDVFSNENSTIPEIWDVEMMEFKSIKQVSSSEHIDSLTHSLLPSPCLPKPSDSNRSHHAGIAVKGCDSQADENNFDGELTNFPAFMPICFST
ncbi:hypothetical protein B9Z55_010412 [Caenorhabditis nigoni]|uniref:Uncharacterized protein n=2 Tax=Caenorhabditis nigoni TaxID=1611254 RepID=A0A2G5UFU7_9PELO|nr:hypothetical protein B9Z55_010412 [Caenorhabditis nigoni]